MKVLYNSKTYIRYFLEFSIKVQKFGHIHKIKYFQTLNKFWNYCVLFHLRTWLTGVRNIATKRNKSNSCVLSSNHQYAIAGIRWRRNLIMTKIVRFAINQIEVCCFKMEQHSLKFLHLSERSSTSGRLKLDSWLSVWMHTLQGMEVPN